MDDFVETAEWLAGMQYEEEGRSQRSADWSPSWAVVRSGAHWLGEITEPQTADTFMVELPTRSWRGTKLPAHLVAKLEPTNVYIDVVAHTIYGSWKEVLYGLRMADGR